MVEVIDSYKFFSNKMPISIRIYKSKEEFVPIYEVSISTISKNTEIVLEKIRKELITEVNLGILDITDTKKTGFIENKLSETISLLIKKHFPGMDDKTLNFLTAFLI